MNYIDDVAMAIWNELAPEDRGEEIDWLLYRNYAVLALTTGINTNWENVHDAWAARWAGESPNHPSLVPFELLPPEIQIKDEPYNLAILEVARRRHENLRSRSEHELGGE